MKRREMIKVLGQTAGGLFLAQFMAGCKSNEGPSNPDPVVPIKTYDLKLYYERSRPVSIPGLMKFVAVDLFIEGTGTPPIAGDDMVWLDDKHFYAMLYDVVPNIYSLDVRDAALDRIDDRGFFHVGRILDIEVEIDEVKVKTRLNDVRRNNLITNGFPTETSEMACFQLTLDGQIISNQK